MPEERKPKNRLWQAIFSACHVLFHSLWRVHYAGGDVLSRREGPFILIANHDSFLDPFVLGEGMNRRELVFLGKKELRENRFVGRYVEKLNMIPVDRHHMDMGAMRACMAALRRGEVLAVFPEGTRRKQGLMAELESGAAMLALRSGVPLMPAYIHPRMRLFRRTNCYFCKPIETADLRARGIDRESCEVLLARITERYAQIAADPRAAVIRPEDLPEKT